LVIFLLLIALSIGQISAVPFPTYNHSDALNYVYYAYSAYCPQYRLMPWGCWYCKGDTGGFVSTQYFTGTSYDTRVYIGYHDSRKEIIVSFRGTAPTSIANWIADIEYLQSDGGYNGVSAKVHDGFLRSYQAVAGNVLSEIMNLTSQFPDYDLILTGHSLGGAQATLLAMDLAYNHGKKDAYLITFGCPRVGNADFATAFNNVYGGRSWRVTHGNDLVPHVPLENMLINHYHHVGTEVWYQHSGNIRISDPSGEDPNGSDGNWFDTSLPDHLTYLGVLYLACL